MSVGLPARTFEFAKRIVKLCQVLDNNPGVGRTVGRQLIRSGTSIGANVEEGQASQSRADFCSKYSIACEEARETHYWLRLLAETEILKSETTRPDYPGMQRADRHSDKYRQEDPQTKRRMKFTLHPSPFPRLGRTEHV